MSVLTTVGTGCTLTAVDLVMVLLVRDDADASGPLPVVTPRDEGRIARLLAARGVGAVKVFASGRRDVVGPAAMLPGSVAAVRAALDSCGYGRVAVMPHVIFDSRLYDGYRHAMGAVPSSGETRRFQADPQRPGSAVDAAMAFVAEGADSLLLEPALFCADVLMTLREVTDVPLAPFSVSGEYTRLVTRDGDWRLMTELFVMLKRAGASQIITYAAAGLAAVLG
jgi:porphobilinogen synthase